MLPFAAQQERPVVNAGYSYDPQILAQVARQWPDLPASRS